MTKKQDGLKTNSIVENKYVMLFKGDPTLKEVRVIPMLFEECPVRGLGQELIIFHLNASMPLVTQTFCAIDISRKTPRIVSGIFLFDPKSREFKSETVFPGACDDGDIISCYRIMNLLESLPIIDMRGNMTYVSSIPHTWPMLSNSVKREVAEDFGMSLSDIEKMLKEYPPDLDSLWQVLKRHHVNVPRDTLQLAVLDGRIELTPELLKRGVKSIEEVAQAKKNRKHLMKPYLKCLNTYFDRASLFCDDTLVEIVEKLITKAIKNGVAERDLILAYTLAEIENMITERVTLRSMGMLSGVLAEINILVFKGIVEQEKEEKKKKVIEFVMESFSEIGRTYEYYEHFLINIRDQISVTK